MPVATHNAVEIEDELSDPVRGNAKKHLGDRAPIPFSEEFSVAGLPGALHDSGDEFPGVECELRSQLLLRPVVGHEISRRSLASPLPKP